ncbi:putative disease resistance protein RGA4 isoform X3 [Malus domestica]|uniref:putative disease resistance protein RGA4 isoform X3 n=1 Tax=Malus domestica TaxID=3750 RepID=UPI00397537BF
MADAIVSVLLERLASATFHYIEDKVENVLNVKKYVQEFTSNLKAIQAVLQDAERRQVEDESVRNWLDSLKEISYQMGDVLDEWNYDLLRQQVEKQEREGAAALVPEKKMISGHDFVKGAMPHLVPTSSYCNPRITDAWFDLS